MVWGARSGYSCRKSVKMCQVSFSETKTLSDKKNQARNVRLFCQVKPLYKERLKNAVYYPLILCRRLVQGLHRPNDVSTMGSIVQGTHRPRNLSSQKKRAGTVHTGTHLHEFLNRMDAGMMCPRPMFPWPKVLGCRTPWTQRPLNIVSLTDVSRLRTALRRPLSRPRSSSCA
jgi:hypothetical protein